MNNYRIKVSDYMSGYFGCDIFKIKLKFLDGYIFVTYELRGFGNRVLIPAF